MGDILCDPKSLEIINDLKKKSPLLAKMIDQVLEGGNLAINLIDENFSRYDARTIEIGLKVGGGGAGNLASEFVIELCNAFFDIMGEKPAKSSFEDAETYAVAVERQEYRSVVRYTEIFAELVTNDTVLRVYDRFSPAFNPAGHNWGDIDNYLTFQKESGHTAKIASHF